MTSRRRYLALCALATLLVLVIAACNSQADDVCENVGDCEQGGNSDWIKACQDDAKAVKASADATGCGGFFEVYYRCAADKFTCEGATASFPGCEAKRANLDECLSRDSSKTACGELERKTASCATSDAGVPVGARGCSATRECAARCYLDNVVDACAPRPAEIVTVTSCTQSCP